MECCYKDSISRDPVHVDTGAGLDVVQVDVAVFCDHVEKAVLLATLCKQREEGLHKHGRVCSYTLGRVRWAHIVCVKQGAVYIDTV